VASEKRIAIRGSERSPLPGARRVGPADPGELVQVTVVVRRRPSSRGPALEEMGRLLPQERRHPSREEFAAVHGADPEDLARIEEFAHNHGLSVVESSAARRSVVLSGTVTQMNEAFSVDLQRYEHPGGVYRGRTGAVTVPQHLESIVQSVLGLDNRPAAKPHIRRRKAAQGAAGARAAGGGFLPTEVARLYNFPTTVNGHGQCIGIIELGGGYRTSELRRYFSQLNLAPPRVTAISVDGGHNRPGVDQNADGEVMLDIEVAGAVASGARIAVYFAPNTDQGFHDAIAHAVHDAVRKPSVISISWGGPETGPPNEAWTQQAIDAMETALEDAAGVGVTVTVASGDNGSTDGVSDNQSHVDFPASSPFVLGCGGTKLSVAGNTVTEVVWNEQANNEGATGGGVSAVFQPPPNYQTQAGLSLNGRGVPDVSGDADPQTGYKILVDGQEAVIGGTSAVAPLYAGLIALLNQQLGQPVGFINPLLYTAMNPGSFRDITTGNNGAFNAGPGWDSCTGLGTPNGTAILRSLSGTTAAAAS
jgi:kumamolisin